MKESEAKWSEVYFSDKMEKQLLGYYDNAKWKIHVWSFFLSFRA